MNGVRLTHIGGPTLLIETGGWRILVDPTFDPPGQTYGFGFGSHSRKLAGPAISADELGAIDVALVTHHHHGDNLDAAGRALLPSARIVVTTVAGAKELDGARGLEAWGTTRLEADGRTTVEVTATPCRHGPPLSLPVAGHVIGFALRWDGQEHGVLWLSGDTVLYDGVRKVADRLTVDTAILNLGAVGFPVTGPLRYTMTGRDAVELCGLIRPRLAIPVHYEGWSHFRQGRESIERDFAQAPEDFRSRVRWLPIGDAVDLAALAASPAGG